MEPRSLQPLSVAVVAAERLRRRCHAILARSRSPRVDSRATGLAGAPRLLRRYRPRVLLLDAATSPLRALRVLPLLKRLSPTTAVILVGRHRMPAEIVLEGLRRGAWGHLPGGDLPRHLPHAIRAVAGGEPWLPRSMAALIVAEVTAARSPAAPRPATRLRLIRGGLTVR